MYRLSLMVQNAGSMYFTPHKLYKKVVSPTQRDENNNPIPNSSKENWVYLCDCFCHDVTVKIMAGYAGKGINPTHYINLDRRDDLIITNEVQVRDKVTEDILATGSIVDRKNTSGHISNYTVIFIE